MFIETPLSILKVCDSGLKITGAHALGEVSNPTKETSMRKLMIAAGAAIAFAPLIGGMVAVAAIAFDPLAQADADASNLDQIVAQAYTQFQSHCTPNMTPQFQRIVWDQGYASGGGGHGRIIDGTQGLGGPFSAWWNIGPSRPPGAQKIVPAQPSGYWDITFEFC
jgi:hypothetical protein